MRKNNIPNNKFSVEMSLVLYHELVKIDNLKKRELLKYILVNLIKFLFTYPRISFDSQKENLFFKSANRQDYNLDFSLIFDSLPPSLKSKTQFHESFSLKFNLISSFKNLRSLSKVKIKEIYNLKKHSFLERIYLYSNIIKYTIYVFPFFDKKIKNLVVFDESQPFENLITQLYNQIDINTITLQHGLYIDKGYPDINYSNLISKYFLSWGEVTKNLIHKYNTGIETVICGKPSLVFENNALLYDKKYVSVIFDHNNYIEQNRKILNIISQFCFKNDLTLNVRFHPHNNYDDYYFDKKNNIINNYPISESEFIIGHSSSLLYECYLKGLKTLKLKSEFRHTLFPLHQQFEDVEELSENLKNFKSDKNFIKNYFGFHERDSIDQYNKFFKSILC